MSIAAHQGPIGYVTDFVPDKEFSTQKAGENASESFERNHQHDSPRTSCLSTSVHTAVACGSTAVLVYIPSLFQRTSSKESCLNHFPACDPTHLQVPAQLPQPLRAAVTCETLLCILSIAIFTHWLCISLLLRNARWRERYFSVSLLIVGGLTLVSSRIIGDSAVLFLQVLPVISDIFVISFLCFDLVSC
jgi:hypothetical protein